MMFPTKSRMDYDNEINRLFPRKNNDGVGTSQFESLLFQSPITNKSSSSADSISPESYFDFHFDQSDFFDFSPRSQINTPNQSFKPIRSNLNHSAAPFEPSYSLCEQTQSVNRPAMSLCEPLPAYTLYEPSDLNSTALFDTPLQNKQRAIVGRKILGNSQYKDSTKADKNLNNSWLFEDNYGLTHHSPEKIQRNYELFPENKISEFQGTSPFKTPQFMSSQSNISTSSICESISPPTSKLPRYLNSPVPQAYISRPTSGNTNYPASSSYNEMGSTKMCTFCRKNGETPMVYTTHCVKEKIGDKHIVTCPILRSHVCISCGATEDNAHTITYCPTLRSANNGKPLKSTTITLKNTRIKSNGRRRY